MIEQSPLILATFAAYLAAMLGIGWAAWRRTADIGDYLLGGRRLGRWVTALSASASDMSGWLLLGLPGYAYGAGLAALWLAGGLLAGTWANWRLIAEPLRRQSRELGNALTLPEFLARRLADDQGRPYAPLRWVAALFILVFFAFYTSAGLVAGGRLFETVFGLDYQLAVLTGAAVVLAYTLVGGFLAVSWTDLAQGALMLAALLIVPIAAVDELGGWQAGMAAVETANPELLNPFTNTDGEPLGWLAILSLAGWGLGYFGQPHILARFMAARDATELAAGRRIAVIWIALGLTGATLVGLAGIGALPGLVDSDRETVFMRLVAALFHPLIAGLLLAAILAAIMSTADSQLLVAASALTEDLYRDGLRPQAGPAELVWVGRTAVLTVAAVATALALTPDSGVLELVGHAWAGFGAAFGPLLLAALYWPSLSRRGALAGLLAGGLTVLGWGRLDGGIFALYELVPGFLAAGLAIRVLSGR